MAWIQPAVTASFANNKFYSSSSSCCYRPHSSVDDDNNNPSRRLALFQLTTAISQYPSLNAKASTLLRSDASIIETSTAANILQPGNIAREDNALVDWINNDKRRMLHVVYRVGDLDKTIKFYTECLGMKLLRRRDLPQDGYANAFLGYGPETSNFTVELTYIYGVNKYDIGTRFGHFGVAVQDVKKTVDLIKAKGGNVTEEPSLVKGGSTFNAFIKDPDGYTFQLLERGPTPEPFCQVMLRVGNLDRAISFYKKAFGMKLLRLVDNPENKNAVVIMGYGPEDKNTVLELTYNYGVKDYDKGTGYAQIAIGTDDVYKTAEAIKVVGGEIVLEPGPLPGLNTKITACLDPDGWKSVFVDNIDFLKELA